MALNNKGQQNNLKQAIVDETLMSNGSKKSQKSIVEVRPQKSITFSPCDQIPNNNDLQIAQINDIIKNQQNTPQMLQTIYQNGAQKEEVQNNNLLNLFPIPNSKHSLIQSPQNEEINYLINKQSQAFISNNHSFQNSIYNVQTVNELNQKSDIEHNSREIIANGKERNLLQTKIDITDLNIMLQNQNFQNSQFNLQPSNKKFYGAQDMVNKQIVKQDQQQSNSWHEIKNSIENNKNGQISSQQKFNNNLTKLQQDIFQIQNKQNMQYNGQGNFYFLGNNFGANENYLVESSKKQTSGYNNSNDNNNKNTQKGLMIQEIDINSKSDLKSPKSEAQQTQHFENSSNGKIASLDAQIICNQLSKQSNQHKLKENEDKYFHSNHASTNRTEDMSMHLHKLFKNQNEVIQKEILKVMLIQVAGMIVEALQIVRRFNYDNYQLFIIFALICLVIEVISLINILIYLKTLSLQIVLQDHTKKIFFFVATQIFRCAVFSNNFLKFDIENSALEVVVELFFIQLILKQVLPNFKIFRIKDKLLLLDMIIFALASILSLDYQQNQLYIQFIQWGLLGFILLIIQFKFKQFPFHLMICNKINIYNAQNDTYLQAKKSYFSQRIIIDSCFSEQFCMGKSNDKNNNSNNNNLKKTKSGNEIIINNIDNKINFSVKQTQNQNWSIQQKEPQLQNNTQFETSNKQEADNMLKDSVQYALLDETASTMYVSKQIIPQIATFFAQKEKINIFAETAPAELGHASPSDFTTIPRQKSQQSFKQSNLIKLFDQFLQNIIIERVDIDTMNLWENFKKQSQTKPLPGLIQDSTIQSFTKKNNNNLENFNQYPPNNSKVLQVSQENPAPLLYSPSTFKELIFARNSYMSCNKVSNSAATTNYNIAYSYKIGLKSKNILISLKEFLVKISMNWEYFKKHYTNKPIVIASFTAEDQLLDLSEIKKYQIKIYPQTFKFNMEEMAESQSINITSIKNNQKENEHERREAPYNFLLVFEEIHQREKIVNKSQFYQILKNLFRCFNNDLTQSLSKIIATSQAGIKSQRIEEKIKDQFIKPIQLSCRIIKYILHNLRDFNDLVGERFVLDIAETKITEVVEHCIMMFKQTSDRNIKFIVDYDQDTPFVIPTDSRRLIQIIITLLSNAHKHTQTGYLKFRIYPPTKKGNQLKNIIRFQVEDTGEGMDQSIQQKLNKLLNSGIGIGYQDFKQISSFGFNLFICNIIAKKLYNPEYQYTLTKENDPPLESNDASGIKFTSVPHKGSQFYFDIKIIENKKSEKIQDSLINYSYANNFLMYQEQNNSKSIFQNKNASLFQLSQPPTITSQVDEQINQQHNNIQKSNTNQQIQSSIIQNGLSSQNGVMALNSNKGNQVQTKTGNDLLDVSEDISDQIQKNQTRTMTFQKQPSGIHSHYKFLKCQCKNVLIIDKVYRNLETIEMLLTNFNFMPQKCCSIKEAITFCEEKKNNDCKTCGERQFVCIFVCTDEFQKQDFFQKDLESFFNDYCQQSIVFAIGNFTIKTKKNLESIGFYDFLSNPLDSIELQHLIVKWKLLPISQSSQLTNSNKNLHVSI
ncbi:ATPase, histidine kinase-, DNA gyrase B (macronuclear) [Tetrahymena thermophila SB210]|uniref:ATPase, histidine kinase-, DNA gyrase B n=1 Tax=Tetrahymena thermophila (strain SB210) TaxID=312017 RepID=I7M8K0_TETTS|nr:ATPase, histidine kinase-, DNA gyrase B [Tetrahymena thermophila SB210]EAR98328.2 ATPase, histidine kinase-, DNA gyrase B [Tetrahymena thermophila SB210]|eukprot:XP_001018573.2 ATPase, histidine kinase-, DNA gyrase B [Tetrahymena thermophila SB210]